MLAIRWMVNQRRYVTSESQEAEDRDRVYHVTRAEPPIKPSALQGHFYIILRSARCKIARTSARCDRLRNRRCKRVCITEDLGRRHCFAVEYQRQRGESGRTRRKKKCVRAKPNDTCARPWSRTFDSKHRDEEMNFSFLHSMKYYALLIEYFSKKITII